MQSSFREIQPFSGHLALDGASFLIACRCHAQTMRGVPRIFFVLVTLGNRHDSSFGSLSWRSRRGSLVKKDHSLFKMATLCILIHNKDDLADRMPLLNCRQRFGRFLKGICFLNIRLDPAGRHKLGDLCKLVAIGFDRVAQGSHA